MALVSAQVDDYSHLGFIVDFRRMTRSCLAIVLTLTLGAFGPSGAQAPGDIPSLPSKEVESAYKNGELDSVVIYIKRGRAKPVFMDSRDSIIAFKYLGVIYSADPQTREKGRYYFNQLLKKDHRATIADLGPGETARAVFKEVREEFFELNPDLRAAEPTLIAVPAQGQAAPPAPAPAPAAVAAPVRKRSHTWLWIAGGVVIGGGAIAVAVLDPPAKTTKLND